MSSRRSLQVSYRCSYLQSDLRNQPHMMHHFSGIRNGYEMTLLPTIPTILNGTQTSEEIPITNSTDLVLIDFDSSKLVLPITLFVLQLIVLIIIRYKDRQELMERDYEASQQRLLNEEVMSGLNTIGSSDGYGTFGSAAKLQGTQPNNEFSEHRT